MKIYFSFILTIFIYQKGLTQGKQHNVSIDLAEIRSGLSLQYELGLKKKLGLFTNIGYKKQKASSNIVLRVDTIFADLGMPVLLPVYQQFDIGVLSLSLGGNYYFVTSKYYNTGLYASAFFNYKKVITVEDGFDYERDKSLPGAGIGLGYKFVTKKITIDVAMTNVISFEEFSNNISQNSELLAHLRVGYLFNAQSTDSGRSRKRRSGRRSR